MIRRSLCALAAVAGLNYAGSANAHPPVVYPTYRPVYPVYRPHHVHYRVMYRWCAAEPWQVYGNYHSDWQAHYAERRLRQTGYQAFVNHGF